MAGLRAALNEHRWPHIELMRDFISDLFEVFIEKGLNVDEVKRLMWDLLVLFIFFHQVDQFLFFEV